MTVDAKTKVLALIGDPVEHSLSPLLHNGWIADFGLDAVYVALRLRSAAAEADLRALGHFGLYGANVTVPHKQAAARAAARSESAVANVLRWEEGGALAAFNTDGPGFLDALDEGAPGWRQRVKRVLVAGAGGAAVGVAEALDPLVDTIHFANRTHARAETAARGLRSGRVLRWEDLERGFGAADLIVQATSLGMHGAPAMDWPFAAAKASAICADLVYRPLETEFLRAARARGLVAVDGLGMLLHQGARAFEIWFGLKPDLAKGRRRLLAALQ